jgi:transcriptional regulator with XRE-family HTH domain
MNESREILKKELEDFEYRHAYDEDFLNTAIALQIRTLREERELTQSALAELIGTQQPGIARLENVNHSSWKVDTLKKLARALDVRLRIRFESFRTLLDDDTSFSERDIFVPAFEDDPSFKNVLIDFTAIVPHGVQERGSPGGLTGNIDTPIEEEIAGQSGQIMQIASNISQGYTDQAVA